MKPRKVYVMLELWSAAPVRYLRMPITWDRSLLIGTGRVLQAQANVARPEPKKKRAKR